MPYDPDRHHRRSIRAKWHNYAGGGAYFLTICTEGRVALFGQVVQGRMELNTAGEIVWAEWVRSTEVRSGLTLVAGVVMPNHLHGLVILDPPQDRSEENAAKPAREGGAVDNRVQSGSPTEARQPQRPARSLGSFVAMFKATTTRRVIDLWQSQGTRLWQPGFYEHIVRSDAAMARIVNYVLTNPLRWHLDAENPDRLADDDFDHWLGLDTPNTDRSPGPPTGL